MTPPYVPPSVPGVRYVGRLEVRRVRGRNGWGVWDGETFIDARWYLADAVKVAREYLDREEADA